ncbi:MAG TPA: xanthine dehydrogenase accessory protein XdhC [Noviherbaspirillum sp.]|jgi:xanthine dehydrogenase accessory factor|uniref:xanthine dehydrogenase accessory protein XdhC n=1 Tax=Noviherbaspirillum sp. TaxID=1926288 RepID=UPI002F94C2A0
MNDWLQALLALGERGVPAVLVTVAGIAGSCPREPGAKMLVSAHGQFDTIGGGHLELRAVELARAMLAGGEARQLARFPLGPALGQCCGGVVHLAFELVDPATLPLFRGLHARWQGRQDSWRLVALDGGAAALLDEDGRLLAGTPGTPQPGAASSTELLRDAGGGRWLADACRAFRPHLLLFGAGHVGAAIVRALGELPCHVTWVDEREELFPPSLPPNTVAEVTDTPEALVAAAAPGASYLVMTHSHALDQRLCEAILRRADAGWVGLIGSHTKRMQFEHRLRERGVPAAALETMVCPIGLPGIDGKQPAVIAASVCAQLLQAWEAQQAAASGVEARPAHA